MKRRTTTATYFATAHIDGVSVRPMNGSLSGASAASSSRWNARNHTRAPTPANSSTTLTIDQSTLPDEGTLSMRGSCGQLFV
jgi:hypothetical protein